jgi:hypothetical protein
MRSLGTTLECLNSTRPELSRSRPVLANEPLKQTNSPTIFYRSEFLSARSQLNARCLDCRDPKRMRKCLIP